MPDHTTLSRRNSIPKIELKRIGQPRRRVDLVIDSSGLVTHGEGRWTRHKNVKRNRRACRKLNIGMNNGFIVAHYLNEDQKADGEIAPHLIKQVSKIDLIAADNGYDPSRVYAAVYDHLKEDG